MSVPERLYASVLTIRAGRCFPPDHSALEKNARTICPRLKVIVDGVGVAVPVFSEGLSGRACESVYLFPSIQGQLPNGCLGHRVNALPALLGEDFEKSPL